MNHDNDDDASLLELHEQEEIIQTFRKRARRFARTWTITFSCICLGISSLATATLVGPLRPLLVDHSNRIVFNAAYCFGDEMLPSSVTPNTMVVMACAMFLNSAAFFTKYPFLYASTSLCIAACVYTTAKTSCLVGLQLFALLFQGICFVAFWTIQRGESAVDELEKLKYHFKRA